MILKMSLIFIIKRKWTHKSNPVKLWFLNVDRVRFRN